MSYMARKNVKKSKYEAAEMIVNPWNQQYIQTVCQSKSPLEFPYDTMQKVAHAQCVIYRCLGKLYLDRKRIEK